MNSQRVSSESPGSGADQDLLSESQDVEKDRQQRKNKMDRLTDMITRLEDKIADQEKRINALEKDMLRVSDGGALSGATATSGVSQRSVDRAAEITKRVLDKLEERGVDHRCLDYWRSNPDFHADLLPSVEDETLPPNRDSGRDESPYWMSRLKKHVELRLGGGKDWRDWGKGKGKGKRSRSRGRDFH
ncbi:unnamed protein product [Amoebophrya sp. A25]|nr:unnamed protein product [Amoebophrya sp. A25]|eukprot:GSA25T00019003001.1